MASLARLPRRRYWYAFYRDAGGVQHCISTKIEHAPAGSNPKERGVRAAENRRLAIEIAGKLEEAERGNAVEAHLRKVLGDISQRVNRQRIEFAATETYLRGWLARAARTKSPATYARYKGTVDEFLKFLGSKAQAALGDITSQDIEGFAERRLKGGRNPTTVLTDLKSLNAPFALAQRQGLILSNPVPAADAPKAEKETREPFTWEHVRALVEAAEGEWKTAIMLGAFTGARLGDCVSLTWAALDLQKQTLRFRPQKLRRKKRDLVLPLHPALESHLLTIPTSDDPNGPLCRQLNRSKIGGRSGLSRQFQKIMAEAGVQQSAVAASGKAGRVFNRYSFHSLRHTYVSMLANSGVPPDVRQLLSGHADAKSHARYTHTQLETLRQAMNALPGI